MVRTLLAAAVAVLLALGAGACAAPLVVTVAEGPEWGWTRQPAPLSLGVTHTRYSLARSDPAEARARGTAVLRGAGVWQAQHLMGFGALNPEPAPGVYDWSSLDDRMALIRETGGTTVFTAAGAPDWMKGGAPGESDYSTIEVAPRPEHYDDFARLTATAVARYPQIRAVQVWNELKGFYDPATNNWDAAGYTDLYNRVYRAVKRVRPDVEVGGPYIPLDAWSVSSVGGPTSTVSGTWGYADQRSLDVVSYWLARNVGADFVVVDGGTSTKDAGLLTSPAQANERFAALSTWVRERTTLPLWWAEFYPEPAATDSADGASSPVRAALTLQAVAAMARAGVATALLWQPQESATFPYAALWTDTASPDGGRPTALTAPWTWLAPRLERGEVDLGRSPDGRLLLFRAPDGMLAVNTSAGAVRLAGGDVVLDGYGTAVLDAGS